MVSSAVCTTLVAPVIVLLAISPTFTPTLMFVFIRMICFPFDYLSYRLEWPLSQAAAGVRVNDFHAVSNASRNTD